MSPPSQAGGTPRTPSCLEAPRSQLWRAQARITSRPRATYYRTRRRRRRGEREPEFRSSRRCRRFSPAPVGRPGRRGCSTRTSLLAFQSRPGPKLVNSFRIGAGPGAQAGPVSAAAARCARYLPKAGFDPGWVVDQ